MKLRFIPSILFLSLITMLLLGGCTKKTSTQLPQAATGKIKEINNVSVSLRPLTYEECKSYFNNATVTNYYGSRGFGKRMARKYQPLLIHIANKSDDTYLLTRDDFTPLVEDKKRIAQRLFGSTQTTLLATSVAIATISSVVLFIEPMTSLYLISATGLNHLAALYELKQHKKYLYERCVDLSTPIKIEPHSYINSLFFVAKENYQLYSHISLRKQVTKGSEEILNFDF